MVDDDDDLPHGTLRDHVELLKTAMRHKSAIIFCHVTLFNHVDFLQVQFATCDTLGSDGLVVVEDPGICHFLQNTLHRGTDDHGRENQDVFLVSLTSTEIANILSNHGRCVLYFRSRFQFFQPFCA